MTTERQTIYRRLQAVQTALKAPKGQKNSYGGYNYRSCEDILEAVKPLLAANGLALVITDDLTLLGDRFYLKATATVYDDLGATISNTAYAREVQTRKGMDDSQVTGSASSYARKYALNGLFAIDDTKDADADTTPKGVTESDREKAARKLAACTTRDELRKAWGELPALMRADNKVLDACRTNVERFKTA